MWPGTAVRYQLRAGNRRLLCHHAGGLDREPTTNELHGAILGYGFSNIIGAFLGCLPTATYSQNVGIVATTKVVNRVTLGLSALIILVAGLFPKFSALLTTIPYAVLGGATVSVFASIAMTGMKLVMTEDMNYRNTSIVVLQLPWNGRVTGIRLPVRIPDMGYHNLRKIPGCHRNPGGYPAECHPSEGYRKS